MAVADGCEDANSGGVDCEDVPDDVQEGVDMLEKVHDFRTQLHSCVPDWVDVPQGQAAAVVL